MRKTTLTSLLILCGSTAALANVATAPQARQRGSDSGNAMRNEQASGVPMANDMTMSPASNGATPADDGLTPTANDTTVMNTPTPM